MKAIQLIDECRDEQQAREVLSFCVIQVDYLAGRVLAPSAGKPSWRVQALFEDAPDCPDSFLLPDGCRRVFVPRGFLGLNEGTP